MTALWPQFLTNSFQSANRPQHATDGSAFYGPYTRLLYHLFGVEGPYEIIPQFHTPVTPRDEIDVVAVFTVEFNKHPVLFILVKPPASFPLESKRRQADDEMRDCFRDLRPNLIIPQLSGISAFGTRVAFYNYSAADNSVHPSVIPVDPVDLNDVTPEDRWNFDILEAEGIARMRHVVEQVKTLCQGLNQTT